MSFREFHNHWEPPVWPLIAGFIFLFLMIIAAIF